MKALISDPLTRLAKKLLRLQNARSLSEFSEKGKVLLHKVIKFRGYKNEQKIVLKAYLQLKLLTKCYKSGHKCS